MKSSFCIDLQRFMLIPTKFPLSPRLANEIVKRGQDTQPYTQLLKNITFE